MIIWHLDRNQKSGELGVRQAGLCFTGGFLRSAVPRWPQPLWLPSYLGYLRCRSTQCTPVTEPALGELRSHGGRV